MASTYSTSLRLELMATGDQSGTWGDTTNTNLGTLLEQAITGVLSVAEGDAELTLSTVNGGSDQARNAVVNLTGAMSGPQNVIVPTANKLYLIKNSTTGGFAVTVKTAAGTGVTVPATTARWVYCDGTNVVDGQSGPWAPSSNDAQALGLSGTAWSDLFLASGGVINWNAGDVTITHSANALAFAGASSGYTFDVPIATASGGTGVSSPGTSGNVLTSNGTTWESTAPGGGFAAGTLMLFQQTAAPTGWTKQTTHNDKALRVVSGTASSGGTVAFSTVFGKTATDNTTITTSTMPVHAHGFSSVLSSGGAANGSTAQSRNDANQFTASTNNNGSGGAHAHGMDIRVQYVDLIIASKDA